MIGQTISHYKILEKLGEGGMDLVPLAKNGSEPRPTHRLGLCYFMVPLCNIPKVDLINDLQ